MGTLAIPFLVTALRSRTPSFAVTGQVHGYASASDGGGGAFRYDPSSALADDGGTVLRPSVGAWLRIYSGPIDVRWFGAKGDGATDDTAAIQAAIDVAGGSLSPVYLPAGVYRVVGTLSWAGSNVSLIGDGIATTRIHHDPASARACISFDPAASPYVSRNRIAGMTIDSESANTTELIRWVSQNGGVIERVYCSAGAAGNCLLVDNGMHGNFDACVFAGGLDAVQFTQVRGISTTQTFKGCYIRQAAANGLRLDGVTTLALYATIVESNGDRGIRMGDPGTPKNASVWLYACHFENNLLGDIYASGQDNANLSGVASFGSVYIGSMPATKPWIEADYAVIRTFGDYVVNRLPMFAATSHTQIMCGSDPRAFNDTTTRALVTGDVGWINGQAGGQLPGLGTVTPGTWSNPTDIGAANVHRNGMVDAVPLENNITVPAPEGTPARGQVLEFAFVQDAVGGHTVTWDGAFVSRWSNTGNVANARASVGFYWDGAHWVQRFCEGWWT